MSVTVRFDGVPANRQNATLYGQALQAMGLVEDTRQVLHGLDNHDQVDLNQAAGQVVVPKASAHGLSFTPTGEDRIDFEKLSGELHEGPEASMKATLAGGPWSEVQVAYQESSTQRVYSVHLPSYVEEAPRLTVVQDKATGALTVTDDQPFPGYFDQVSTGIKEEKSFPPEGPADLGSAPLFQRGTRLVGSLTSDIQALKALDNGPFDLNPQPGVVVTTGFKGIESDNWSLSNCVSPYFVPTDASLVFDPATGEAREMRVGFGDQDVLTFQRDQDGTEHFGSRLFLDYKDVTRKKDGSLTVQEHSSTRAEFQHREEAHDKAVKALAHRPWYVRIWD